MAHFIFRFLDKHEKRHTPEEPNDFLEIDARYEWQMIGHKDTYKAMRFGKDLIASIGYVAHIDGKSLDETLSWVISSFKEEKIIEFKKSLVGQYILLIKKDSQLFIFSDFVGGRNIFYSESGKIFASSFSLIEEQLGTNLNDLDTYKLLEFLAVKHVLYPALFGHSTMNKRISWLLPYEYLVIDTTTETFRIGSIVYCFDNSKQNDVALLSDELLSISRAILWRPEFKDSIITASLSGGRDSRLIAAIAAEKYKNLFYRIAYAPDHYDSLRDMDVATKLAHIQGIPLKAYRFEDSQDDKMFGILTEGFAPTFNNKLAPLLNDAGAFSLGFGGVFGTELFMPISELSINDFIHSRIEAAKQFLKQEDSFWRSFQHAFIDEFINLKKHFNLISQNEQDYIRLFIMLNTARYSSYILSAFNHFGYQLEPYGSHSMLNLALRVSPSLWGSHRSLGGDAKIQQYAMLKLNRQMAKVLTYKNYRPMLPLSPTSLPLYVKGAIYQGADLMRRRFIKRKGQFRRVQLPGGFYLSNGWERYYIDRTQNKYGLCVHENTK